MFKKTLLALALTTAATANAGVIALTNSTGTSSVIATVSTCDGASTGTVGTICVASETAILAEAGQSTPVPFDFNDGVNYHNTDGAGTLIQYDPASTVPVGARLTFTLADGYFADANYDLVLATNAATVVASLANVIKDADDNVTAIELTIGVQLAGGTTYNLSNGAGAAAAADESVAIDTISIELKNGTAAGGTVAISATARDNLGNLSSAAAPAIKLLQFEKQFVKATAFAADNAVVDVAQLRKDFDTTDAADTTGGDLNTTTNLTMDITDNVATLDVAVAAASVTVAPTVTDTGSFAGINHSTTVTTGLTNAATSQLDGVDLVQNTTDLTKATVPAVAGTTAFDSGLVLEINNDDAQNTRTVSVSSVLDLTAANAAFVGETIDFGTVTTFSLNGKNAQVPYMPFGDNTQIILRATNTSTQTGDLSVRYMEEGSQTTWKDLGVVGTVTPGVNNIADVILAAIKSDSGLTKGKLALDITVNAPSANVNFYAAYKVVSEMDRGFVGNF